MSLNNSFDNGSDVDIPDEGKPSVKHCGDYDDVTCWCDSQTPHNNRYECPNFIKTLHSDLNYVYRYKMLQKLRDVYQL